METHSGLFVQLDLVEHFVFTLSIETLMKLLGVKQTRQLLEKTWFVYKYTDHWKTEVPYNVFSCLSEQDLLIAYNTQSFDTSIKEKLFKCACYNGYSEFVVLYLSVQTNMILHDNFNYYNALRTCDKAAVLSYISKVAVYQSLHDSSEIKAALLKNDQMHDIISTIINDDVQFYPSFLSFTRDFVEMDNLDMLKVIATRHSLRYSIDIQYCISNNRTHILEWFVDVYGSVYIPDKDQAISNVMEATRCMQSSKVLLFLVKHLRNIQISHEPLLFAMKQDNRAAFDVFVSNLGLFNVDETSLLDVFNCDGKSKRWFVAMAHEMPFETINMLTTNFTKHGGVKILCMLKHVYEVPDNAMFAVDYLLFAWNDMAKRRHLRRTWRLLNLVLGHVPEKVPGLFPKLMKDQKPQLAWKLHDITNLDVDYDTSLKHAIHFSDGESIERILELTKLHCCPQALKMAVLMNRVDLIQRIEDLDLVLVPLMTHAVFYKRKDIVDQLKQGFVCKLMYADMNDMYLTFMTINQTTRN